LIQHLIVVAVAAAVTALATPGVRRVARRLGAVDVPEDRKVHKLPTPTSGGVAIYAGVLAGVIVARFLPAFRELFGSSTEPVGVMVAATLVCGLGVVDDVRGMKAPTKLAGQILASGALVLGGVSLFYFWMPGVGVLGLSQDMSALITVLWAVAVINALNLVDGLDGLAAGVTAIAAGTLFVYAYRTGGGEGTAATLIPAVMVGACLGFLPHNFNPARIFMGDSGSMLLGLLLASSTVSGVGRTVEPTASDAVGLIVPVLLPFFVLAVPLADASFAIMRRMRARTPVFHPDKSHIHHWLLEMARSHRQAVIVMYSWSAMLAAAALVLSLGVGPGFRFAAIGIGVALVASIVVVPRMLRRGAVWMAEMREMDAAPTVTQEVIE
jgi:UDP-GlcNAc:undecaprenyl-phosphate/decaprenyl-phosphate GlcNAc-1-phosphate transferase